ncbi:STAS domain-containing protein [Cryptosporangium aurantiacum]|uniref:Anti-anti-sigma factor n=1 Tax=Cryptosporangium aurantiacum TaxID=134849 RepID=A0A1M7RMK4_9ACTN|nr:STAS domain-containing protein [Cryptosporangium aurantiacum]SHN47484.1 anti-anti-sigma factor [Cryptosporangium aurantiacum]
MDDVSAAAVTGPVQWVRSDQLLLVWVRGAVDPAQADLLEQVVEVAAPDDRIVLDLTAVTFFGSAGLKFLATLGRRVDRPVVISGLPDFVRTVLVRTGMHALVSLPTR